MDVTDRHFEVVVYSYFLNDRIFHNFFTNFSQNFHKMIGFFIIFHKKNLSETKYAYKAKKDKLKYACPIG